MLFQAVAHTADNKVFGFEGIAGGMGCMRCCATRQRKCSFRQQQHTLQTILCWGWKALPGAWAACAVVRQGRLDEAAKEDPPPIWGLFDAVGGMQPPKMHKVWG
eukprot:1159660-Pelagomonas_calceolata.AAC.11